MPSTTGIEVDSLLLRATYALIPWEQIEAENPPLFEGLESRARMRVKRNLRAAYWDGPDELTLESVSEALIGLDEFTKLAQEPVRSMHGVRFAEARPTPLSDLV